MIFAKFFTQQLKFEAFIRKIKFYGVVNIAIDLKVMAHKIFYEK